MNGWAVDIDIAYEGVYTLYFDSTADVVAYLESHLGLTNVRVRPWIKEYEGWEFLELYKEGKAI